MTMPAMLEWLRFLRDLPEYQGGRCLHRIRDGYATHRCDDVLARAGELAFVLHFIPGLTDLLQPLDRSVFGALKVEYRDIYRYEMSQREVKRMAKADFAAILILALCRMRPYTAAGSATTLVRGLCWHNCGRPLFSDSLALCRWGSCGVIARPSCCPPSQAFPAGRARNAPGTCPSR
jgi:hypothetical protein